MQGSLSWNDSLTVPVIFKTIIVKQIDRRRFSHTISTEPLQTIVKQDYKFYNGEIFGQFVLLIESRNNIEMHGIKEWWTEEYQIDLWYNVYYILKKRCYPQCVFMLMKVTIIWKYKAVNLLYVYFSCYFYFHQEKSMVYCCEAQKLSRILCL